MSNSCIAQCAFTNASCFQCWTLGPLWAICRFMFEDANGKLLTSPCHGSRGAKKQIFQSSLQYSTTIRSHTYRYVQKLTVCDTASWQSFSRTRKQWNTHHIRPSAAARCPTGIPDELVLLISGGSVCILSQYVLLWLLVLMCPQSSLWVGMENAVSRQAGQLHTERRFSHGTKVRFAIGTARPHTVSRHGSHHPQLAMRKN